MRATLWYLALFGVAVAVALFAGNNQSTVTVFWPPYRVDLSLNMVLLLLFGAFVVLHAALRALAALLDLPHQANRWRMQQKERAMHTALLDGIAHLLAGRFVRAGKAADGALAQEAALEAAGEKLALGVQVRALSHLIAAESAQALQNHTRRDEHLALAMQTTAQVASTQAQEIREGTQLRAARWALEDRDASAALERLEELPQGASRRTLALRLRLKAARQARRTREALETARLLGKHRAFSAGAAKSIVRGLATEWVNSAHDTTQLLQVWNALEPAERAIPELAIHAAQRLATLGGDAAQVRQWLLPVWELMLSRPDTLPDAQQLKLVTALEAALDGIDADWLARIESAQLGNPRDPRLLYLAGAACVERQLWGKAQALLAQAAQRLQDGALRSKAWRALALLAEQRDDTQAAADAWKNAALSAD